MDTVEIHARLCLKRDTQSNWEQNNPVLLNGEMVIVDLSDGTIKTKTGNGTSTFTQLEFNEADPIIIDTVLSESSGNAIQNKVVYAALAGKAESDHTHGNASLSGAGFMTASQYNKLANIASGATKVEESTDNGHIKINSKDVVVYVHPETHTMSEVSGLMEVLDNKIDYSDTDRLMTNEEGEKLAGIEAGANNYTHPTSAGNKHIPSGGASGQVLKWSSDGTAAWGTEKTYSNATGSQAGLMSAELFTKLNGVETGANKYVHPSTSGSLHIPAGGSAGQILKWAADGNAVWGDESVYELASQSADGLLSSEDKTKLDNLPSSLSVDSVLDSTSENPIQNKAVANTLGDIDIILDDIVNGTLEIASLSESKTYLGLN